MQPRLPRWAGGVIFILGGLTLTVLIFVLPEPFGVILLLLSMFTIAPALMFFSKSHGNYWQRIDEQKRDALGRTMKVKKMIERGSKK